MRLPDVSTTANATRPWRSAANRRALLIPRAEGNAFRLGLDGTLSLSTPANVLGRGVVSAELPLELSLATSKRAVAPRATRLRTARARVRFGSPIRSAPIFREGLRAAFY